MSNTLIILVVLGVINFLIKKFASKPKEPQAGQTTQMPRMQQASARRNDETSDARAMPVASKSSLQSSLEHAARRFADQARALGLVDEQGNYISSSEPAQPVVANPKPIKVARVSQKPIGVTDFAPKDSAFKRSRTVQAAVSSVVANADSSVSPIISKSAIRQSPTRPISAIDALVASRLSQRISLDSHGQTAQPKRIWNAKSMRQGMVMAEILSPPLALRA